MVAVLLKEFPNQNDMQGVDAVAGNTMTAENEGNESGPGQASRREVPSAAFIVSGTEGIEVETPQSSPPTVLSFRSFQSEDVDQHGNSPQRASEEGRLVEANNQRGHSEEDNHMWREFCNILRRAAWEMFWEGFREVTSYLFPSLPDYVVILIAAFARLLAEIVVFFIWPHF